MFFHYTNFFTNPFFLFFSRQSSQNRAGIYAVESMVISWTHIIYKVLRADSAELLEKGKTPGPKAELDFWRARKTNIQSIHEQVSP